MVEKAALAATPLARYDSAAHERGLGITIRLPAAAKGCPRGYTMGV
jgi:hypothetical protein